MNPDDELCRCGHALKYHDDGARCIPNDDCMCQDFKADPEQNRSPERSPTGLVNDQTLPMVDSKPSTVNPGIPG